MTVGRKFHYVARPQNQVHKSFDSRSVVLSFKPLTGGLSQNGTTLSTIKTLLPTGSLPTKSFSLFVPLFLHTKVFHKIYYFAIEYGYGPCLSKQLSAKYQLNCNISHIYIIYVYISLKTCMARYFPQNGSPIYYCPR